MQLIYLHSFLVIVSKLAKSVKYNLLFHLQVVAEAHIIPIENLEFAVWFFRAKYFEKVGCCPWPLKLRDS